MDWNLFLSWAMVLLLFGYSIWALILAYWSRRWPSVKGKIEVSLLDDNNHELAYSYVVNGQSYLGADIRPCGPSSWKVTGGSIDEGLNSSTRPLWNSANEAVRRYPPDAVVNVYYCPWNPKWSCLEQGGFLTPLLFAGIAAAFSLALI